MICLCPLVMLCPLSFSFSVDRPLLQHANSSLVLREGSRLSLTCTGLFPIEWMYPAKKSKVDISSHLTPPGMITKGLSQWIQFIGCGLRVCMCETLPWVGRRGRWRYRREKWTIYYSNSWLLLVSVVGCFDFLQHEDVISSISTLVIGQSVISSLCALPCYILSQMQHGAVGELFVLPANIFILTQVTRQ